MNRNNNQGTNVLKNRLMRNQNDYVPIQQVTVPSNDQKLMQGAMDYPEALPVVGAGVGTAVGGRIMPSARPLTNAAQGGRATNLNELNVQMVKNSSKLFQMDIKLKAIEKQIEAYKYANNPKYYEMTEKKMLLLREYQVIVAEQNLIEREIKFQRRSKQFGQRPVKGRKPAKGKKPNMVNPGTKKKPRIVARGVESYQVETDRNVIVNPNANTRYANNREKDECEKCCENCDGSDAEGIVLCCYCLLQILEAAA